MSPESALEFGLALSADEIEAIHETSLRVLEELGIEVMSGTARELLASHGAEVDASSGVVRLDRALVMQMLQKVPSTFTLVPRNVERRLEIGGSHLAFGLVAGPPNVHDCERGRRAGKLRVMPATLSQRPSARHRRIPVG